MGSPASPRRRTRGDDGVTLILFALAIVAILFVVAIVIDLSNVRNSRQDNKLLSDAATTAGLQSLAPDGVPLPWQAVCTALDYLEANESDLTLSVEYRDGSDPPTVLGGNPCASLLSQECDPLDRTTWAWIHAVAGEHTYDIKSGYVISEDGFPEDQVGGAYNGDEGDSDWAGCDQIAVISSKTDDALFGGIGGVSDYDTALRSVGRADIGERGSVAIALVLLEQNDCLTTDFAGGGATGEIIVRGTGDRPGIIHSDSDGTADGCPGNPVVEGKQNGGPRARALAAPALPTTHGIISTYHHFQGGTNGANWTSDRMAHDTEVWMCDPDSLVPSASPCDTGPSGSDRVTRTPADDRFLEAVTDLRTVANPVFASVPASPATAISGYTTFTSLTGGNCNFSGGGTPALTTITAAQVPTGKLYVNCDTLRIANGKEVRIEAGITEVLFRGVTNHAGDGLLDIRSPARVYVNNVTNASNAMDIGASGRLRINENAAGGCVARQTQDPQATTELVVRRGGVLGRGSGQFWLCSTFMHLMGGDSTAAPVNVTSGTYPAPYDNSQNGSFDVGGGGSVQWTAPNTVSGVAGADAVYDFEDLAVWSETQADNSVQGGGGLVLSGIFFLPNTGPSSGPGGFTVQGASSGTIELDAQLWVRKFQHAGGASFRMRANPEDSILVPFLEAVGLVR